MTQPYKGAYIKYARKSGGRGASKMRADKCKGEGGLRPFVRTQGPCFPTNLNVSFF